MHRTNPELQKSWWEISPIFQYKLPLKWKTHEPWAIDEKGYYEYDIF